MNHRFTSVWTQPDYTTPGWFNRVGTETDEYDRNTAALTEAAVVERDYETWIDEMEGKR